VHWTEGEWRRWRAETKEGRRVVDVADEYEGVAEPFSVRGTM